MNHESYRAADGRWLYPEDVENAARRHAPCSATPARRSTVGRVEAMSKSKRNTVDPGAIIARYGADTARWFILSDNPPDRDMEWTEAGVAGAFRFTQRVFRLADGDDAAASGVPRRRARCRTTLRPRPRRTLRRATHRTIAAVTEALETFAFNVAVARLYEFVNAITEAERAAATAPASPGRGGRRWRRWRADLADDAASGRGAARAAASGRDARLVAELPWPEADPALLAAETVTIAVQVMGKLRATIAVPPNAAADAVIAAAEAEPNVARALAGKRDRQARPRAQPHRQFRGRRMMPRAAAAPLASSWPSARSGPRWRGCGFQPVYMPTASGTPGPAQRELAAIHVALIPDRPGMLLRQALQDRFEGAGDATARRYDLTVSYWIAGAGIGIQPDTTVTRIRMIGNANWTLTGRRSGAHADHLRLRPRDGCDEHPRHAVFSPPTWRLEVVQKRLADALADQITLQLAAFFRKRAASARSAG